MVTHVSSPRGHSDRSNRRLFAGSWLLSGRSNRSACARRRSAGSWWSPGRTPMADAHRRRDHCCFDGCVPRFLRGLPRHRQGDGCMARRAHSSRCCRCGGVVRLRPSNNRSRGHCITRPLPSVAPASARKGSVTPRDSVMHRRFFQAGGGSRASIRARSARASLGLNCSESVISCTCLAASVKRSTGLGPRRASSTSPASETSSR